MRSLKLLNKKMRKIEDPGGGDGLLLFILETIVDYLEVKPTRQIVEFGAHPDEGGVVLDFLIQKGYKAILIEGATKYFDGLCEQYKDNNNVTCINCFVDYQGPNTLEKILSETDIEKVFDVLLIDVDSIDYQIWESFKSYQPLVVVIEYNETYGPNLNRVHNKDFNKWAAENNKTTQDGFIGSSSVAGSSLTAINDLAKKKGYALLTFTRNNAFFVKEELFHYFHLNEIDIERNYTPALLNIPNRVLSISDIIKKVLNFGLVETFFMYRQQKRFGIVTKIKGLFRKAS